MAIPSPFDAAQGRQDRSFDGAQDRPIFRSAARTVYVYATVQSKDGRLVPNLTREDFEVLDNGRPQVITTFDNEAQTITLAAMFDMSGSMHKTHARLREASVAFIEALWPDDRLRIGSFGSEVAISPLLSNHKPTLLRIVDEELWPGGGTPLWLGIDTAMTSLAKEPGRRVVLAFTDGKDSTSWVMKRRSLQSGPLEEVRDHAERDGFMIYAIGLQGADMDDTIRDLANDTGGGHFIVKKDDDLGQAFARVVEELHHQYVIGFSPEVLDGRQHTLTVRTRQGGLKVRARKNYVAIGDGRS
jgi:Ca-activated chloride channel homolog